MNKELCFAYTEMAALADLVAGLNRNGIGYDLSKDEAGVYIRIHRGF